MRRVTAIVLDALEKGQERKVKNTETDGFNVWLFGNKIIQWDKKREILRVSLAGWDSPTTRDRVNAALGRFGLAHHYGFFAKLGKIYFSTPDGNVELDDLSRVIEIDRKEFLHTLDGQWAA